MTTTLDKLLAEKQALLERLQEENIGPAERDEIERLLENVEAAVQSIDKLGRAPVNRTNALTHSLQPAPFCACRSP
jgi:hypothetical protein